MRVSASEKKSVYKNKSETKTFCTVWCSTVCVS